MYSIHLHLALSYFLVFPTSRYLFSSYLLLNPPHLHPPLLPPEPHSLTMATSPNFHVIESPTQFQDIMSADLNRVSLINFWAPWAEPCKQMNEVVRELAKKYPQTQFLEVCGR